MMMSEATGRDEIPAADADKTPGLKGRVKRMKSIASYKPLSRGQALIEFSLVLPVLFLLIVNVVNFGGSFTPGSR